MSFPEVVVVGAGLAGLVAARRLAQDGRDVVVLEARDRVGGRTWSRPLGDSLHVEAGGQFVGPGQHRILALAAELGIGTFGVHDEGRHVLRLRGRHRTYRQVPRLAPWVLADVGRGLTHLLRASRRVRPAAPWETRDLDDLTFEQWIRAHVRLDQSREMLRMACRGLLAAEPSAVSALHVAFLVASAGGVRALTEVPGGAQERRLVGGAQQVSVALAGALGDRVRLNDAVERIEWSADRVTVRGSRGAVRARRAILAVPPALAARIAFDPALPTGREQLAQRLPHGDVVKANVLYERPWWRDLGLSGQGAGDGIVRATFDNTPPEGAPAVLMGFFKGGHTERRAILAGLADLFGPRVHAAQDVVVTDWSADPWTRGCYGANFPSGVWTEHGRALRASVGPLHWAGSETAERWMLYMDGAVESGERAAAEILARN